MIVLGADMHKSSHSIVAVDAATGQMVGEKTVAVGARGFGALVLWARGWSVSGRGRLRTAGMSLAAWSGS